MFRRRLPRKRFFTAQLLLDVGLVLAEEVGAQLDVAGFVDTMNVTETGGNTEVGRDFAESRVHIPDVLGLCVQTAILNASVVDTIFLTAGDTDLHLEPLTHFSHTFQVLDTKSNVFLLGLLRQVKHVRREQWFLVLLEVGLIRLKHAIKPRKKLLGAVIRVHDDGAKVWVERKITASM
jgi:hypothetical protein